MDAAKTSGKLFQKCAALGFILLILLGNYWFVMSLAGGVMPIWLLYLFYFVASWTILAGFGMILQNLARGRESKYNDGTP